MLAKAKGGLQLLFSPRYISNIPSLPSFHSTVFKTLVCHSCSDQMTPAEFWLLFRSRKPDKSSHFEEEAAAHKQEFLLLLMLLLFN